MCIHKVKDGRLQPNWRRVGVDGRDHIHALAQGKRTLLECRVKGGRSVRQAPGAVIVHVVIDFTQRR